MGHYYVGMFPKGEDKNFGERWARYQQACAREIEEIISKNPIKFEDILVGKKVGLYSPLKELSKIKFDEENEPHVIKVLFRSSANFYGMEMWRLFWADNFVIYDKREKDFHLRISPVPKNNLDLFPAWVDFRYFEKIIFSITIIFKYEIQENIL
jgi:hypothetical protein